MEPVVSVVVVVVVDDEEEEKWARLDTVLWAGVRKIWAEAGLGRVLFLQGNEREKERDWARHLWRETRRDSNICESQSILFSWSE